MLGIHVVNGGCGPGTITVGLTERVAPGNVVGIDRDRKQIAAAGTVAWQAGAPNLRFVVGDIFGLPFSEATVDIVHLSCVLTHLAEPFIALKEAW
jgi:ubiquinone/menaquinone biosynthesis C-methylase UbiE